MRRFTTQNGRVITLGQVIQRGGEAEVFRVPGTDWLAKIYHRPAADHPDKLACMIANPPADPTANLRHISIAWPVDLLWDNGHLAGFLMPNIVHIGHLIDVYHPGTRRKVCPLFNWKYLHCTAVNLASAVAALHLKDYCIGDLNESNILVNNNALITLIDTDSFQIPSPAGMFRCPVGKPEFTPPEFIGFKLRPGNPHPGKRQFRPGGTDFQTADGGFSPL